MTLSQNSFIREKFDILLVTALFVFVLVAFLSCRGTDAAGYLKDVSNGLLYALLALLGVRRLNQSVGTATTETGDVVVSGAQPPTADPSKEKEKDETSDSHPIGD